MNFNQTFDIIKLEFVLNKELHKDKFIILSKK